ncbi:MAG: hypothetical protein ACXAE3_06015 [Candidatus Kariarchaeaceae archaeon]|jgi:hypothetical protein
MDDGLKTREFVQDWLNHFNYPFQVDVKVNSKASLDFVIPEHSIGIYVIDWKRPISVQVANKAIAMRQDLDLKHLYLIAREISEPARRTLDRYSNFIVTIHPNGLSELAIGLARTYQTATNSVMS